MLESSLWVGGESQMLPGPVSATWSEMQCHNSLENLIFVTALNSMAEASQGLCNLKTTHFRNYLVGCFFFSPPLK